MRTIKFRAWDTLEKKWFEGNESEVFSLMSNSRVRYSFAQFTGLRDKNGKEIYERDICKVRSISVGEYFAEVVFGNGIFSLVGIGCSHQDLLAVPLVVEVIGNVYEDPELLKV